MNHHLHKVRDETGALTADLRALLDATHHVTVEIVVKARQRLAAALDNGKQIPGSIIRAKPIARAKAAKQVVGEHPIEVHYAGHS